MATISNTPRPGYVWDSTDNVWYPIGVGAHQHTNAADTPAVMPYSTYAAAGKNKVINGDFGIWQRGATFNSAVSGQFLADRFSLSFDGTGATRNVTQQTFTPGTAPQAGYEGKYFIRIDQTVAGTGGSFNSLIQKIEDVRNFAGQTITVSFWAKANTNVSFYNVPGIQQQFGVGGSASVTTNATGTAAALTTSWQRFSYQIEVPSIAGKTIATDGLDALQIAIRLVLNTAVTVDIWGVQLEAGSTVTAFQTATGNPASELAACQRYYWRSTNGGTNGIMGFGVVNSDNSSAYFQTQLPVAMRVTPTSVEYSTLRFTDRIAINVAITSLSLNTVDSTNTVAATYASGSGGLTAYRYILMTTQGSSSGYIAFNAEL